MNPPAAMEIYRLEEKDGKHESAGSARARAAGAKALEVAWGRR